jgi:hypothetical protein
MDTDPKSRNYPIISKNVLRSKSGGEPSEPFETNDEIVSNKIMETASFTIPSPNMIENSLGYYSLW